MMEMVHFFEKNREGDYSGIELISVIEKIS